MAESLLITRDTCENWNVNNPILRANELGLDTTHNRIKIGNGVYKWSELQYVDKEYNDFEIKAILSNIVKEELPAKADKEDVYTKAEINDMNLVSERDLARRHYVTELDVHRDYVTRHDAEKFITHKDMHLHNHKMLEKLEEKADKSDTYNKIEVDKKIAEIEFCHHGHHHSSHHCRHLAPCTHNYNTPSFPIHCDCDCEEPIVPPTIEDDECVQKLFQSVYVKGEIDAFLEKKADKKYVHEALWTKADKSYVDGKLEGEYYTIEEINDIIKQLTGQDLSSFVTQEQLDEFTKTVYTKEEIDDIIKELTGDDIKISHFATKDDIEELEEKVDNKLDKDVLETLATKEEIADVVKYEPYQGRKTIQLANYDSISGVTTDGRGANLVMLSKWDVADFGSTQVHANINTSDTLTLNDDKVVALIDDVDNLKKELEESLETKASLEYVDKRFESVYTKEDVDGLLDNTKKVANAAKTQTSDLAYDLANNYMRADESESKFQHLEDEIAEVGSALTKLIKTLEDKGIIDKGVIIVPNAHKYS